MNDVAEAYVRLVLALGQHDADFVDAYYGPPEWRADVERESLALDAVLHRARDLTAALERLAPSTEAAEIEQLRHVSLSRQLSALIARAEQLQGRHFTFDEESRALYDATAPTLTDDQMASAAAALEGEIPGAGPLPERLQAYRASFVIPPDRLEPVFDAALDASRTRTLAHLSLPPGERFTWERVSDKPWSGYNWYQGGFRSLIQINADLPVYASRALDLACHEGYPGHHVYNALLEYHLVRERGWREFTVYALNSPQSLIAEGTANYGVDVAFTRAERLTLLRDTLFPLAGLDPGEAERYDHVTHAVSKLDRAGDEIARRYTDGQVTAAEAAALYVRYTLMERARAEQRVRFVERYRAYTVNYTLGEDLVRASVEAQGGTDADPARRWELFAALLTTPRVPSTLSAAS